jgi:FkbM family methyltransferase
VNLAARKRLVLLALLTGGLVVTAVLLALSNRSLRVALDAQACPPSKFEGATYFGQFYEDYVLGYVFEGVRRGSYIDVGANHPLGSNVTALFYLRGWRGITIEPNPVFAPLYAKLRPEDTHLNIGVGKSDGEMVFHRVSATDGSEVSGMSTFDDKEARELAASGYRIEDLRIGVATLNTVLERHPLPNITLLSIDVEGFEEQVLQGIDLRRHRPAVIVLEADAPRTEVASHHQWEGILLRAEYLFAMSDGLNRYYVRREAADLLPRFVHIDMCVKQSKLRRKVRLDGWRPWDDPS